MKSIRNKKGFTLVEVIATVVILGILLTTAIVGYNKYIKKAKTNYYSKQEDLVTQAGRDFFNDNRGRLPINVGEESCVLLSTLISNKYIDPVNDYNKNPCNQDKTKVCAQKISLTKYEYETTLVCDDTNTEENVSGPNVNFKLNDSNFNEGQTFNGEDEQSYTINMELEDEENNLKSYKYVIHKEGMKNPYYTSNSVSLPKDTTKYIVNIPLNSSGTYYIEGISINGKGKKTTKKSGKIKITINKLVCENAIVFSGGSDEWYKDNITVNFTANSLVKYYYVEVVNAENEKVIDGPIAVGNVTDGKNISNYSYQIKANDGEVKKVYFKVTPYDKNSKNNSCVLKSKVYKIDKGKPTVSMDTSDGVSTTQTIKLQCNDNIGVTGYYYGTTAPTTSTTYITDIGQINSLSSEGITKTESNGATYYFACKDAAGNVTSQSKTYYKTTLQPNKSTVSPTPILTLSGSTFTIPVPTPITGYDFTSWCSNSTLTTCLSTTYKPTANGTLYGKWTAKKYTISYTMNGGSNPSSKPVEGVFDSDVSISNPATKTVTINIDQNFYLFNNAGTTFKKKEAKTSSDTLSSSVSVTQPFTGWTSSILDTNLAKSGTSAKPTTSWDGGSTKNTHFMNLRETGTVTMIANWDNSSSVKLPVIKKFGYKCSYNTKSDGTGTSYEPETNYKPAANASSSITLYPVCKADKFTVVYAANRENYLLNNKFTNSTKVTGIDDVCSDAYCACHDDPSANIDNNKLNDYLKYNSYTSGDKFLYHINEWPTYDPCTVTGYDMNNTRYKYFAHLAKGDTDHGNIVAFPIGDSNNEPNNLDLGFQLSDVLRQNDIYVLSVDIKSTNSNLVLKTGIRDGSDKTKYYSVPIDSTNESKTSFDISSSSGWTTKTIVFRISSDFQYRDKFSSGYGTTGDYQNDYINSGRPELFFSYEVKDKSKRGTIYIDNVRFYKADTDIVEYNDNFIPTATMDRNGHTFAGWFKDMSSALNLDTSKLIAGENIVLNKDKLTCNTYKDNNSNDYNVCYLYAGWFEKEYKVTLKNMPSGTSQSTSNPVKFSEVSFIKGSDSKPVYSNNGKIFKGFTEWINYTSFTSKNDPFLLNIDPNDGIGADKCDGIYSFGGNNGIPNSASFDATYNKCGYDTSNYATLRFDITTSNPPYTKYRIFPNNDRFPNFSHPGFGGYCQSLDTNLTSGQEYVHVIILGMGDGLYMHYDTRNKSSVQWLTNNEGNAAMRMYVYKFVPKSSDNKICVYFSQHYDEDMSTFERQHMSANLYFSGVYKKSEASNFLGQLCSNTNCSSSSGCCSKTWTAAWKDKPLRVYYNAGGADSSGSTYDVNSYGTITKNNSSYYDLFEDGSTIKITKHPVNTFNLQLDSHSIVSGSEWGTDIKLNTNYSFDTLKSKATDVGDYYRIILTANWKANTSTCTITYNANGGTVKPTKQSYTCPTSGTIQLLTPTRTGYKFNYWTYNGNHYNGGSSWNKTNNGNYTLTANWTANTYKITYNANGGSGAPGQTSYTYAASGTTNLSTTKPTRSGYTFLGWSTSSTATSASYQPGQAWSKSNAANYTLYAVWKKNVKYCWQHTGWTCTYYYCTSGSTYTTFVGSGGGCTSGYTFTKINTNTNSGYCTCTNPCGAWKENGYYYEC